MGEVIGKGTRVRVTEGENEGVVGEIFWLGRSKFGPELRAGIDPDEDDEKVWVMAVEIAAIDDDGNVLDPQPRLPIDPGPKRDDFSIRAIELPFEMARDITAIRLQRGYPETTAASTKVRLENIESAEEQLGCTIPDAVIAYLVSGVGETPSRQVGAVVGLTRDLQDSLGDDRPLEHAERIVFDDDNGNFLVFARGSARDATSYQLLDHEEGYETGPHGDLGERLSRLAGEEVADATPAFEVIVDYVTRDEEPEEESDATWVTHAKFGRGTVADIKRTSKGDKLTIEFEDGETRVLLARFVQFDG